MSIFNLEINLGLTGGKCFIIVFLTLKSKSTYAKNQLANISTNFEYFLFWDQFWPSNW